MKQFKSRVPSSIRLHLELLAKAIEEQFNDTIDSLGSEARIESILGNSCDGYWAYQDGGFEVSIFTQSDQDTSNHFTQAQTDCMDKQQDFCWKDFCSNQELSDTTTYNDL